MATIAYDSAGTGAGAKSPLLVQSQRMMKIVTGNFTLDTSYPTGGEDVTDIFNQFSELKSIVWEKPTPTTVATRTITALKTDYSGKKVIAYGEDTTSGIEAEFANASNLSTVPAVRFVAIGYA